MFLVSSPVRAADPHAVVVLNMGRIMTDADAVKSVNQQTAKLQDIDREQIKKIEAGLRKERTKLHQQKTILPKAQYEKKVATFNKKKQDTRKKFQQQAKRLRAAKSNALGKIRKAITPIVTKIVNERKVNMVIAKAEVLFAKKELNITDTVLAQLNSTLKTVKVDVKKSIIE